MSENYGEFIYIVRQQGIYWHEIVGISTSESEAIDKCKHMASLDVDDYHAWVVTKHKIGEFTNVNGDIRKAQSPCASESIVFSINADEEVLETSKKNKEV